MSILSVRVVLVILYMINDGLCKPFGHEETDIVQPKFYNILIRLPNILRDNYEGRVEILTIFSNATKIIKLNVYNTLTIESTKILHKYKGQWETFPYHKHWTNPNEELYIIEFEYDLMKNKEYKIIIEFSGINNQYGLFVGSSMLWVGTNLRRYGARRLFPCFDSKILSSNFSLQLQHLDKLTSAAMTLGISEIYRPNNDYTQTFQTTNFIAPYMLHFVIGEFTIERYSLVQFIYLRNIYFFNVDDEKFLQYIDKETTKILTSLKVYFKPKPVSVQILIVERSVSCGFITLMNYPIADTFMQSLKLLKYKLGKDLRYQLTLQLCEQYFYPYRSLPVCDGFAKFMEYSPVLLIHEEFTLAESDEIFLTDIQDAMLNEALLIQNDNLPIGTNWNELTKQYYFDETKYDIILKIMSIKRGAVFRIFEELLSRLLVQIYLDDYLLEHGFTKLTEFAREKYKIPTRLGNVENILFQWDTVGFPLINIEPESITQQRFRYDGINEFSNISIPISYAVKLNFSENETDTTWMTSKTEKIDTNDWLLVNLHSHGYYRVNYTESQWMYLTKKLLENSTIIESVQRTKLIDDAFQLARAGKIKYDIPLNLATYLVNETSYGPWKAAINNFNFIESLLETESEFKLFTEYLNILMNKIYNNWYKLDAVKRTPNQRLFQREINAIVCRFNMYDCVTIAETLYKNWYLHDMKLPQHLISIIACTFFSSKYDNVSVQDYWARLVYPTMDNINLAKHYVAPLGCLIDQGFGMLKNKDEYSVYLERFNKSLSKAHLTQRIYLNAVFKVQGSTMNGRVFLLEIFRKYFYYSHESSYLPTSYIVSADDYVNNLGKTVLHMTNDCELEMFHYIFEQYSDRLTDKQRQYLDMVENRAKMNILLVKGKKESIIKWIQYKFTRKSEET